MLVGGCAGGCDGGAPVRWLRVAGGAAGGGCSAGAGDSALRVLAVGAEATADVPHLRTR